MTPKVLFDYAVNTGKFYDQHVAMAREGASHKVWNLHARVNILPAYRKEHHEPHEGMSSDEFVVVAADLADYYRNHISEF
jgi:hypothetical protein